MNTKKIFILTGLLLSTLVFFAQVANPGVAKDFFKNGNFAKALKSYEALLKKEPNNPEYLYRAGLCILRMDVDKLPSINYLKKASELKADPDVDYYLGQAYHFNLKLFKAIATYKKYKAAALALKGTKIDEVDRQIEMANNAKKLILSPIDITFENVGKVINTEYPDYYPFVTPDESFLVFTSRRKGVVGGVMEFDGFYSSDIFYSKVTNGRFIKPRSVGTMINTTYDEQAVGLSSDGNTLYIYMDNVKEFGDIYYSEKVKNRFQRKQIFDKSVNSVGFESSGTISPDGSTLFFASNRAGSIGGKDLYMTRKLPTGEWAEPQNLGDVVNTPYDEDFPNMLFESSTLYFSSKGHNSMGGFDYFKTTWNPDDNTWSKPENLGYPLNTPEDNVCISFVEGQRAAYLSTWRKDSFGGKDLYKVTFNDIDQRQTIIKSKIVKEGDTNPIIDAFVIVTDNRTQEEIGNYTPHPKTGEFVIVLKPGSYNIMIDAPGYAPKSEDIAIKDKSDFVDFMTKKFVVVQ